jgi:hypothetical protein
MKLSAKRGLIIFAFCLVMGGFLWFQHALSTSILQERSTIEGLAKQETDLKGVVSRKNALLDAYRNDLNKIKEHNFEFPADNVSFFAYIERVMAGNNLKINKVNPTKPSNADRSGILVACEGDYYNLLDAISEMRANKMVVRVSSLSIRGQGSGPVTADMLIETIMRKE